jgi:hypothetical protein
MTHMLIQMAPHVEVQRCDTHPVPESVRIVNPGKRLSSGWKTDGSSRKEHRLFYCLWRLPLPRTKTYDCCLLMAVLSANSGKHHRCFPLRFSLHWPVLRRASRLNARFRYDYRAGQKQILEL